MQYWPRTPLNNFIEEILITDKRYEIKNKGKAQNGKLINYLELQERVDQL